MMQNFKRPIFLFVSLHNLVLALTATIFLSVFAYGQNYISLFDGIEYAAVEYSIKGDPVKIYLLRLDPAKVRLDVVHAMDSAIGLEKTSSLARRHGAIAAINGGFFRNDESIWAGEASGVLFINNRLLSESNNNRTALFIDNPGKITNIEFAPITIGSCFKIAGLELNFTGINRERNDNDLIEYTPEFGRSTLTLGRGLEVIVKRNKIVAISEESGSNIIPQDGIVISATGEYAGRLKRLARIGRKIERCVYIIHQVGNDFLSSDSVRTGKAFSRAEDITGGVSELLRNGRIHLTWKEEKAAQSFAENRHPRTAIAKFPDGRILLAAVDGRRPGQSVGMTLQELAEYLLSIGVSDAMNLDGGGSTTMYLDGRVVNNPSDAKGERRVGDAIIVTLRSSQKQSTKK